MGRLVVAALVCALALTGCGGTLDDAGAVQAALPTKKDVPGYVPSNGITSLLGAPTDAKEGANVLTAARLDAQCDTYEKDGDGWACEQLQGLGVVAYANEDNVDSRVCSFVLAYESGGVAKDAWKQSVEKARKEFPEADESEEPGYGDESVTFAMPQGSIVVMRSGSVVSHAMSYYDYGYEPGGDELREDPIEMWAGLQEKKVGDAL